MGRVDNGGRGAGSNRGQNPAHIEIEGTVTRVKSDRGDWTAGTLRAKDGTRVEYSGAIAAKEGDAVRIRGKWTTHEKWGDQFKVAEFEPIKDLSAEGLARWLSHCDAFKGIGDKRAHFLAQFFGADFERVIAEEPERVAEVSSIPLATIQAMALEWKNHAAMHRAIADLVSLGIGGAKAKKIWEAHGTNGAAMIRKDPYWLIGRVQGFAFLTVDAIARNVGIPKEHPSRIREGLLFTIDELTESDGSTWSQASVVLDAAEKLLALDVIGARGIITRELRDACSGPFNPDDLCSGLVSIPKDRGAIALARNTADFPDNLQNWFVMPARIAEAEQFVSQWIANATTTPPAHGLKLTQAEVSDRYKLATEEQCSAIANALSSRISIITGGAGTGKTWTVTTLRELAMQMGLEQVALCAPTGKAARRLEESTKVTAKTIHMLLIPVFSGDDKSRRRFSFAHPDTAGFLDLDLLVVDEVSMVDTELLRDLLRAVGPRTSIVLIGDPNQLPPVGAGSFLRDAIDRNTVPIARLTIVQRNAGYLKEATVAVLQGKILPGATKATADDPEVKPWYVANNMRSPEAVRDMVGFLFNERLAEYQLRERDGTLRPLDPFNDCQVLVPMKKGIVGLEELNKQLQSIAAKKRGVDIPPEKLGRPQVGDKIVWTRNRYDLGLMNGTTGRVMSIDTKSGDITIAVDGEEKPIVVPSEDAREMMLSYAMTVHRSQGSEYNVVLFLASRSHGRMLFRSLFYTAVSRAKFSCMVLGDDASIRGAAGREVKDLRRTLATLAPARWCRKHELKADDFDADADPFPPPPPIPPKAPRSPRPPPLGSV